MAEVRVVLLLLISAALLLADTFKLYLKEGGYHAVREYSVQGERVHYFSTERGEWEDIPADLVDLAKTEKERQSKDAVLSKEAQQDAEEEKAVRAQQREIAAIPMNPGAYFKVGEKVDTLPSAEYQVVTSKKRKALQVLSPIPLIPGKASVVIKGEHSSYSIHDPRPNFFLRLDQEQRFGIITLAPRKGQRVVENISIIPVANVASEERKQMETFEQDLGNGLFRIWPTKDLAPGEYALVEFADKGDINDVELTIWDFAVQSAAPSR
jgi:hypothetical protein